MSKLSIITINLNNREGLVKTIKSVLDQSFTDFEFIIIDGGSKDGSIDIIKQYSNRITCWISEPDSGVYNAMNKGINLAHGEYLQFLNSGDWLYTNTVLEKVFELNRTEDIVYGDAAILEHENELVVKYPSFLHLGYLYDAGICHQATFIKRMLFDQMRYNESLKVVADWEFLLIHLFQLKASVIKIDIIIVYYDNQGMSSQDPDGFIRNEELSVLRRLFPPTLLQGYEELCQLKKITRYPLYRFIEPMTHYPRFQQLIKFELQTFFHLMKLKNKTGRKDKI